jgi:hypothetical protein
VSEAQSASRRETKPQAPQHYPAGVEVTALGIGCTSDDLGRVTDSYSPDALGGTLHTQTLYNPGGQVWKSIDARGNWTETD